MNKFHDNGGPTSDELANFLVECVDNLGVAYQHERSFRISAAGLFANRFLLTVRREDLAADPTKQLLYTFRKLEMPAPLQAVVAEQLPQAEFVHFGFEESAAGWMLKVYLENSIDQSRVRRAAARGGSIPLHLSCKWQPSDVARRVVSRYLLYPALPVQSIRERLSQIYQSSGSSESFEIAAAILDLAAGKMPADNLQYLEVLEDENERRSFDINLYDADLKLGDLSQFLSRMRQRFAIDHESFATLYDQIRSQTAGHLAGGVHRDGLDFFNVYYGASRRESIADEATTITPRSEAIHMSRNDRTEFTSADDRYFNYCWWPYAPVAEVKNKFRPVNLLFHSYQVAGIDERAFEVVDLIRDAIGPFRTVWGVKQIGDRLGWEFYIYDYQRRQRDVSITRVLEAIRPLVRCTVPSHESLPYFMFSIDIDDELVQGRKDLDVIHMYVGNPGSSVSSGIAYAVTAEGKSLENFYFFFDAKRQLKEAAEKICSSVHFDSTRMDINRILRSELVDCHTICIGNKQTHDTAYFSGVNVDQFLFFLKLLDYRPEIIAYVEENRASLDHLLYDVGFDYTSSGDELTILKSGYYGVF